MPSKAFSFLATRSLLGGPCSWALKARRRRALGMPCTPLQARPSTRCLLEWPVYTSQSPVADEAAVEVPKGSGSWQPAVAAPVGFATAFKSRPQSSQASSSRWPLLLTQDASVRVSPPQHLLGWPGLYQISVMVGGLTAPFCFPPSFLL